MSRIGKKPIFIPDQVEVKLDKESIDIKGPKGQLVLNYDPFVKIEIKDKNIEITPNLKFKNRQSLWGLYRALIANCIEGVTQGFEKKLEIEGVGFRAEVKNNNLFLNIGLSHQVEIPAVPGIAYKVEKNVISVSGIDKQKVGQMAAKIRAQKKPEPYKGKGIRYQGEQVRRKSGKKSAASE